MEFSAKIPHMSLSILPLCIAVSGIVEAAAVLCKPGTVARAVPAVLVAVPFECAAQMRASFGGWGQQVDGCLKSVYQ